MASYQKRKNGDGSTSFLAWVRLKGFNTASKSFPNFDAAEEWAEALETELRKQRNAGEGRRDLTTLTLRGLIDSYLADPETKSLKTYDDVERLLAWWVNHCGGEKVMQFGTVKLREARTLLSNGRKPATVNRYLSALRSCWNWGRAAQFIPAEKVWPTRLLLTEPDAIVRFLDDEELRAVLDEAKKCALWMHAAVVLSIATGLRQSETLRLEWSNVDFVKGTVTVLKAKNTKGRATKRRIVHLPSPAVDELKNLRRNGIVGPSRIFVNASGEPIDKSSLRYHWIAVRKAAGLVEFRWHDLRHSCASFLAQNGASLVEIGSVLGHSSPSITAKYAHLVAGKPVTGADMLAAKLSGALSAKL
jgi:integrase